MPRLPQCQGGGSRGFGYSNGLRVLSPLCDLNRELQVEARGFARSRGPLPGARVGVRGKRSRMQLEVQLGPSAASPRSGSPAPSPASPSLLSSFPLGVGEAEWSLALLPTALSPAACAIPTFVSFLYVFVTSPHPVGRVCALLTQRLSPCASGLPRSGRSSLAFVSLPSPLATKLVCDRHPTFYVSGPGWPHPWVARAPP